MGVPSYFFYCFSKLDLNRTSDSDISLGMAMAHDFMQEECVASTWVFNLCRVYLYS